MNWAWFSLAIFNWVMDTITTYVGINLGAEEAMPGSAYLQSHNFWLGPAVSLLVVIIWASAASARGRSETPIRWMGRLMILIHIVVWVNNLRIIEQLQR